MSVKAQVVNLMLDLQASMGLAYLFISHDIAVVERMCHRVAVMYLGEIVEIGPRAEVFGNPQHPYTKKLMAAVPIPDPSRRQQKRGVSNDEIKSPVRAPDYVPPVRQYREISPATWSRPGIEAFTCEVSKGPGSPGPFCLVARCGDPWTTALSVMPGLARHPRLDHRNIKGSRGCPPQGRA